MAAGGGYSLQQGGFGEGRQLSEEDEYMREGSLDYSLRAAK